MDRRSSLVWVGALALLLVLPALAAAQQRQMVLQIDAASLKSLQANTAGEQDEAPIDLAVCDYLHEISPDYCTIWHVEAIIVMTDSATVGASTESKLARLQGMELKVRGASGVKTLHIDRVTPIYHLDSGATFAPAENWNAHDARGEKWLQVGAKSSESQVVAGWTDVNHDGLVGPGDELTFAQGATAKITDIGIGLHVSVLDHPTVRGPRVVKPAAE